MIKATALASTITIMEITGIARTFISQTFKRIAIFLVADAIHLVLNFTAVKILCAIERYLSPYRR